MSGNKIGFGPGVHWGAYSFAEERRKARDPVHPLVYRVQFAARGWINRIGHAQFAEGELAEILGKGGKPARGDSLSNAIREAKRRGLIAEESNVRCLVIHPNVVQNGGHGTRSCKVHGVTH